MGDVAGADLRWWERRSFVLATAILAMLPLLLPQTPPLVDLPGHMGRFRVQLEIASNPLFQHWFRFDWALIGNLGLDLLVEPLAPLLGLETAVKLIVMAIPALTVLGLLWIAREVHGRIPPTAAFALPLAYGFPFHFGFVNFALSMALALNAFAFWLRLARQGRIRLRAVLFVPISATIWLVHTFGWGTLGVLAFSAELIRQHDRGRSWFAAWLRAAIGCLPLAPPMLLMIAWRSGHVSGRTTDWFNWQAKLIWLESALRDRWRLFDLVSIAILAVLLTKGLRDPRIEYSRNLGLSALFLLLVFLCLPRIVFGSAYADMRLVPYMIAVAVISLRPKRGTRPGGLHVIAAMALAFFLIRIGATTASFLLYDRSYRQELAALRHVPEGARVVSFVGRSCGNPWLMSRLEHLPAMGLVRRRAFSNDQWSMEGGQLLTVRYEEARGFNHDPSQIVTSHRCPREWWKTIDQSLLTFPRDAFDYVWLIQPPPYQPRLTAGMTPVWRHGSSVLYRIDDPRDLF